MAHKRPILPFVQAAMPKKQNELPFYQRSTVTTTHHRSGGDARRRSHVAVLAMKPKKIPKYPCIVQNFINLKSRGQLREAVDTLPLLSRKGILLNSKIISSLLQQCASEKSIKEGTWVHVHLKITRSNHPNTFLANHLVNMYAKCGEHAKARKVFDKMPVRNLYSWNNMLAGYANLGMGKAAKRLFDKMPERDFVSWNTMVMAYVQSGLFDVALRFYMELRRSDIGYNEYSFAGVLTVCVKLKDLWLAKQLHCQVFVLGYLSNVVLSSSVLDAYAKCGEMGDAKRLFDEMKGRDILAWTTLLSGYVKCGDMKSAQEVFDEMPEKNSVSWTSLIAGYTHNGMGLHALQLFTKMIELNVNPDQFTYSSLFFACASIISPNHGMQLHSHLITAGIRLNVVVLSSIIDMYSKCGSLGVAKRVFDTTQNKQHVLLWNTMISALAHHGCGKQAIKMFIDMVRLGVKPDSVTFLALINACSHSGLVEEGLSLFESMKLDYKIDPNQQHYACLIDLLGRSGRFDEMMNQLKKMQCEPDDRVWNALVGVCRSHGNLEQVRELMRSRNLENDWALSWLEEIDRKLHIVSKHGSLRDSGRDTFSVLELLADKSSLHDTER